MGPEPLELPSTVPECHALIRQLEVEMNQLRRDVALLKRELFGCRRERFVQPTSEPETRDPQEKPEQKTIVPAPPEDVSQRTSPADARGAKRRGRSPGRQPRVLSEKLERKRVDHRLDDQAIPAELRDHPRARRFFRFVREELEVVEPRVCVIEHYEEVIVLDDETGETRMLAASAPDPLLNRCYAGPGLLAHLTAARFADHLPYYRLEDILARSSVSIHRATQWRWMRGVADLVRPLVDLMRERVLQSRVLGMDETPIPLILPELNHTRDARLWVQYGDAQHPYACFYFSRTRAQRWPQEYLQNFQGYLQSDAYICYEVTAWDSEGRILGVGCWAHARRKFEALLNLGPDPHAQWALATIQKLYDIEDRVREMSDPQRHAVRQAEARPIVEELQGWLEERSEQELPKSALREAVHYMWNRWEVFQRYLEDGAIPIDNNRTEAALKGPVVGKKNWYFLGNERSGETAALLYTLTMTCKRHHIDVLAYLNDVLRRVPGIAAAELESLLPDHWIAEHPEARVKQRVQESHAAAHRKRQRRVERRMALAES